MKTDLYYYINTQGEKVILDEHMSSNDRFSEGKASYHRVQKEGRKTIREDVIIDIKGNILFETPRVLAPFSDGLICCEEGYRNEKGDIVLPITWKANYTKYKLNDTTYIDLSWRFFNGLKRVATSGKNGVNGFINQSGEIVIEPQHGKATDFFGDYAIVENYKSKNPITSIINNKGELLYDLPDFVPLYHIDHQGFIPYILRNKKNQLCFWDVTNQKSVETDISYDITNFHKSHSKYLGFYNGYCQLCIKGKWGLIDTDFNWVIEPKFKEIGLMSKGLIAVRKKMRMAMQIVKEKLLSILNIDRHLCFQMVWLP
ncbi:WG repeat-containing protein [Aquimarina mytili]|uniref:WG repeat-containing protein n=1 Tax=Aquimarina mytili TaxID=874423 RepID=A0A937A0F2_9FLAO|nr:WG repeat-containing protein [Aquimarina mytili]